MLILFYDDMLHCNISYGVDKLGGIFIS